VTAPHVAHTWLLGWTVGSIGGDNLIPPSVQDPSPNRPVWSGAAVQAPKEGRSRETTTRCIKGLENVNRSIYGSSQPRHTRVLEKIPAISAPTVPTVPRLREGIGRQWFLTTFTRTWPEKPARPITSRRLPPDRCGDSPTLLVAWHRIRARHRHSLTHARQHHGSDTDRNDLSGADDTSATISNKKGGGDTAISDDSATHRPIGGPGTRAHAPFAGPPSRDGPSAEAMKVAGPNKGP